MPIHHKTCVHCKEQFVAGRSDAIYCTAKCRSGAWVKKQSPAAGTINPTKTADDEQLLETREQLQYANADLAELYEVMDEFGCETPAELREAVTNWRTRALAAEKAVENAAVKANRRDPEEFKAALDAELKKYEN